MGVFIKKTEVKNVLIKSNLPAGDYSANPYSGCAHACKYCYASFMKRFTGHQEPWGTYVDVKYWPEIKNSQKYAGKEIIIGSVTDPYQPAEEKYGRTRALLKQMKGSGAKISIITKSDLVLRDLDLIKTFPGARVSWSVNTLDASFQKDMDKASSVESRLGAMKSFYRAGVDTVCFISPIFPGITDAKTIIKRVKRQCGRIWLENLNLRGDYKKTVIDYIRKKYPSLLSLYWGIYNDNNRGYWEKLDAQLKDFAAENGLAYIKNSDGAINSFDGYPAIVNFFYHEQIKKSAGKSRKIRV